LLSIFNRISQVNPGKINTLLKTSGLFNQVNQVNLEIKLEDSSKASA